MGRMPKLTLSGLLPVNPEGQNLSEATVARLEDNHFLLCGPTLADLRDHDWLTGLLSGDGSVSLRRSSDKDAALMIMGPLSRNCYHV